MTAADLHGTSSVGPGDALQADHFRKTLFEERERIVDHVAKHRDQLGRRLEMGTISGVAHLRSQVQSLEAELRYVDGLLAKLDGRFAGPPTDRR
ncbi:hypothetical protein TUM20985_48890 [Mycobacterium antarcticum]|uniref:hypothetical protein n=1 Tax=unclassified Mycolicibacterium TaxID=2636767 RepID=UPI00238F6419|nr:MULTISPECIES: hypothetical protein [unclassified Mycolicibacterium]BDX34342.1 hypothetical protein TUM20985_48890 [Mycolicibacterium sp. TUM20985]GLP77550.1 hypothetical protein TUM20983_46600 [Mycolicibacterium sp. TUM20983]GLP82055.1 hypothetical protein TUM20984_34750 [Mycolicibacterium sp. TUM20984]